MYKVRKYIWGFVLIAIGLIIGLNSLEITNINVFFDGWWTFIIIIPCFVGLFDKENITGNLIGLVIGVALLLTTREVIRFDMIAKLIIPFILVSIGISMVFSEKIKSGITEKVKSVKKGELENIVATFAGQKVCKDSEEFKGANLDAVFGGITLDLRNANFEKESVINASSIFAGIDIILPTDVNVKVKCTPIFGGVSNKINNNNNNEKTIYVEAFCLFGGIDIK